MSNLPVDQMTIAAEQMAIVQLLHRYAHAVDYGGDFATIFTRDGVYELRNARSGELMWKYEGTDAIQAYMDSKDRPPVRYDKHLTLSPIIEIDRDRARAQSYWVVLSHSDDGVKASYGHYSDELVKLEERWLLAYRLAELEANFA